MSEKPNLFRSGFTAFKLRVQRMLEAGSISRFSKTVWVWLAALALFIALSVAKMPEVMLHGRLWAEEGSVFMPDMASRTFLQAIAYNYRGSVQLINAVVCWFAIRSSATLMPYVATYAAFLVSGILFLQMAFWAKKIGGTPVVILAFLVGWFFLPDSYEIWLTSTNIQWLASLSLLLVLLLDDNVIRRHAGLASVWVLLCGLTGVPSCMLAPGFLAKGVLHRSRPFALMGGLLACATLIQGIAIVTTEFTDRSYDFHVPAILQALALGTLAQPLLGVKATNIVSGWPATAYVAAILFAAAIIGLPLLCWRRVGLTPAMQMIYIVGLWLLVTLLNILGSIPGATVLASVPLIGSRYFFFGASCFLMALVLLSTSAQREVRLAAVALLVVVAANGVGQRVFSAWPERFLTGPSWAEQVAQCPKTQTCVVEVWPATIPPSEISLSPQSRM